MVESMLVIIEDFRNWSVYLNIEDVVNRQVNTRVTIQTSFELIFSVVTRYFQPGKLVSSRNLLRTDTNGFRNPVIILESFSNDVT